MKRSIIPALALAAALSPALAQAEELDTSLCIGEVTDAGPEADAQFLLDGLTALSGVPSKLFAVAGGTLELSETPPMFGWPSIYRMHEGSEWCYINQETFDSFTKFEKDPNTRSFDI